MQLAEALLLGAVVILILSIAFFLFAYGREIWKNT